MAIIFKNKKTGHRRFLSEESDNSLIKKLRKDENYKEMIEL